MYLKSSQFSANLQNFMMNRKNKGQSLPLQTINEKPGNEDSSFIVHEDPTLTTSLHQTSQVDSNQEISMKKSLGKKQENSKQEQKKQSKPKKDEKKANRKNKKEKKSEQPSRQKINITQRALQTDFNLIDEMFKELLEQSQQKWRNDNRTEKQIEYLTELLQDSKKGAFEKIISNSQIIDQKEGEEVVPIEVSLSKNVYKMNEFNMGNLNTACEKVKSQKPVRKPITFHPDLPEDTEIEIVLQDGSKMLLDEYVDFQAKKCLSKQIAEVKMYEEVVKQRQKRFQDCLQIYHRINQGLVAEMNGHKKDSNAKKSARKSMFTR